MKTLLSLALMFLVVVAGHAQGTTMRGEVRNVEYDKAIEQAVRATSGAFPFVYTVVTDTYKNGQVVSSETVTTERQASGVERTTRSLTKDGKTVQSYGIMTGLGKNTYCSTNGTTWTGPQENSCVGPGSNDTVQSNKERFSVSGDYTYTRKYVDQKEVKVYREYSVYHAPQPNRKREFREKITSIDARGFLIEINVTEGILDPRTVTFTRKESWTTDAKFEPVKAPK